MSLQRVPVALKQPIPARRVLINYRLAMTCWFFLWRQPALTLTPHPPASAKSRNARHATPFALVLRHPQLRKSPRSSRPPPLRREISRSQQSDRARAHASSAAVWLQPVTEPHAGPAGRGSRARKKKRAPPPPRFEVVERRTGIQSMRAKQRLG